MTLHLARIGINPTALHVYAAMRSVGDDDGLYAVHHALRKRFGDAAPQPFHAVLTGPEPHVVGYLAADDADRIVTLAATGEQTLDEVFTGAPETRGMPTLWENGARLTFRLRGRPVVRYSERIADHVEKTTGWRPPANEIDAVIAESRKTGIPADPEKVCRTWLERRLGEAATIEAFTLRDYRRTSSRRSSHGPKGRGLTTGPDAAMSGILTINNGVAFEALLAHGIGRHAAFGYGMMMVARAS